MKAFFSFCNELGRESYISVLVINGPDTRITISKVNKSLSHKQKHLCKAVNIKAWIVKNCKELLFYTFSIDTLFRLNRLFTFRVGDRNTQRGGGLGICIHENYMKK